MNKSMAHFIFQRLLIVTGCLILLMLALNCGSEKIQTPEEVAVGATGLGPSLDQWAFIVGDDKRPVQYLNGVYRYEAIYAYGDFFEISLPAWRHIIYGDSTYCKGDTVMLSVTMVSQTEEVPAGANAMTYYERVIIRKK